MHEPNPDQITTTVARCHPLTFLNSNPGTSKPQRHNQAHACKPHLAQPKPQPIRQTNTKPCMNQTQHKSQQHLQDAAPHICSKTQLWHIKSPKTQSSPCIQTTSGPTQAQTHKAAQHKTMHGPNPAQITTTSARCHTHVAFLNSNYAPT